MLSRMMFLGVGTLLLMTAVSAAGQQAEPEVAPELDEHIAWLLAVFDADSGTLAPEMIRDRFVESYLGQTSSDRFISTMGQMVDAYGPLTFMEHHSQPNSAGQFIGEFVSAEGRRINVAMVLDADADKLVALIIGPAMQEIDPRWMQAPVG